MCKNFIVIYCFNSIISINRWGGARIMDLKYMQALPHKWWKKDVDYKPCTKNLPIEFGNFRVFINPKSLERRNFELLKELTLYPKVNPTIYDWLYAINTELLEFQATNSVKERYEEMADIAIFCALCLKYYFNVETSVLTNPPIKSSVIVIQPLYYHNDDDHVKDLVLQTYLWASQSPFIEYKINYNQRRIDHGCFRH